MKPYITYDEAVLEQGDNRSGYKLLTEKNGCVAGCCSGISFYGSEEFSSRPGCHDDQEGFFVLEGEGYAKLDELIFPIKSGDSFIAAAGVAHTIKKNENCDGVKVFWFHSAMN